jgi:hypothetical protein
MIGNTIMVACVLTLVYLFIVCSAEPFAAELPPAPIPHKYFLALMVSTKNDGMILHEFLEHHFWQGVEHAFVIDNGSTDDTKHVLQQYIDDGRVSYYYMDDVNAQIQHYNVVYRDAARRDCRWLMVIDTDEFVYNRHESMTVSDFLKTLDPANIACIYLRWKMFGSSGHLRQPADVRSKFIWREAQPHQMVKCIVNTIFTSVLGLHTHTHTGGVMVSEPDDLAINHYAIMSREYFGKIKMTRGDAVSADLDNVRDWKYFRAYDNNEVCDSELANLCRYQTWTPGNCTHVVTCSPGQIESL